MAGFPGPSRAVSGLGWAMLAFARAQASAAQIDALLPPPPPEEKTPMPLPAEELERPIPRICGWELTLHDGDPTGFLCWLPVHTGPHHPTRGGRPLTTRPETPAEEIAR